MPAKPCLAMQNPVLPRHALHRLPNLAVPSHARPSLAAPAKPSPALPGPAYPSRAQPRYACLFSRSKTFFDCVFHPGHTTLKTFLLGHNGAQHHELTLMGVALVFIHLLPPDILQDGQTFGELPIRFALAVVGDHRMLAGLSHLVADSTHANQGSLRLPGKPKGCPGGGCANAIKIPGPFGPFGQNGCQFVKGKNLSWVGVAHQINDHLRIGPATGSCVPKAILPYQSCTTFPVKRP